MPPTLTHDILIAALAGMKLEQQRLQEKIAHVQNMLDETSSVQRSAAPATPTGKRKQFSSATRRRMAQAQKARWQKIKGGSARAAESVTPESPKPKRQISEEGMKRIIAATKKRWRLQKAQAKNSTAVTAKTTPSQFAKKSAEPKKAAKKASPKKNAVRATKTAATDAAPAATAAV